MEAEREEVIELHLWELIVQDGGGFTRKLIKFKLQEHSLPMGSFQSPGRLYSYFFIIFLIESSLQVL